MLSISLSFLVVPKYPSFDGAEGGNYLGKLKALCSCTTKDFKSLFLRCQYADHQDAGVLCSWFAITHWHLVSLFSDQVLGEPGQHHHCPWLHLPGGGQHDSLVVGNV